MKNKFAPLILIFIVFLTSCSQTKSEIPLLGNELGEIDERVGTQIEKLAAESGVPSMAVGILVKDQLVWARGYGQQPDLSTVYSTGSIDKSFTASAIMLLAEQGKIDLDDDINQYLPFSVRHPDYPDTPVTIRMLLAHQSGLPHDLPGTRFIDNDGAMLRWMFKNMGNKFMDLYRSYFPLNKERYLKEVFSPDSKYGTDFWAFKPGSGFQYSNSGYYLLLGTIIEEVAGQSYQDYIKENIILALSMENTSFQSSDFPEGQIAAPYENTSDQGYSDLPLTGMSGSGKLRTTVPDLARFLLFHMNLGEVDGVRILEPESIDDMHQRIIPMSGYDFPGLDFYGTGYGWSLWGEGLGGHSGGTPGYFAQILTNEGEIDPYGVVMMMTYGCSITECDFEWFDDYFVVIRELLLEHAEELSNQ